jgi:hypothetical protein
VVGHPYPPRMAMGTEAKEIGLECHLGGGEGTGGGNSLLARILLR